MEKINIKAFALAWGVSFGLYALLLGWVAYFGWAVKAVEVLSSIYIGYAPTFLGGLVGGIWAFIDATIGGAIIAFVYNLTVKKSKR